MSLLGTIAAVVAGAGAITAAILLYLGSAEHHRANDEAHRQINSAIDGLRNELKAEVATKASTEDVDALRIEVRDGFRALGEQIAGLRESPDPPADGQ